MSEEEVERDGRPSKTISQCRYSSGRKWQEQKRKREMKAKKNVGWFAEGGR